MKKIFTILLALSALSILVSGCKKADETTTDPGKTETKTDGGETAK